MPVLRVLGLDETEFINSQKHLTEPYDAYLLGEWRKLFLEGSEEEKREGKEKGEGREKRGGKEKREGKEKGEGREKRGGKEKREGKEKGEGREKRGGKEKRELTENEFVDKVLGVVFGVAIGDAVGLASEFQSYEQAAICYGNGVPSLIGKDWSRAIFRDSHRTHWQDGDWTDDTDQMILLIQSFIENPEWESKGVALSFASFLLSWAQRGFAECGDGAGSGIGMTVTKTLMHPQFLEDPHAAAEEIFKQSEGRAAANGGVMRTAICGVPFYYDLDKTVDLAVMLCKVTHADTRCVASAVAVSVAVAMILQGYVDKEKIKATSFVYAISVLDEKYHEELRKYIFACNVKELELHSSNSIGYTFKAMGCAFTALSYASYQDAIIHITKEAGDADTNAAVAGGMLGAWFGYSLLPSEWGSSLIHKEWLCQQTQQLIDLIHKPNCK